MDEAGDKAKEGFLRGIRATGQKLPPEIQSMVTAIGDEFREWPSLMQDLKLQQGKYQNAANSVRANKDAKQRFWK